MSTSAGTRPSAAAMERFGVSGNDKRVSYFSAKDDTDDDDDDDTLVVIGQSDSRTTEEPPSPETSRYSRRGKTRRQGRDGSWCWINEVEQRASAEDTRPRAKTTEAKTFTATIHNCSREEIVRRGVKPPSALNLSSAMPARRDGDGAATVPFSPIPEVKTVGTLKQQLRTKSSVTGSDHRDRARASRSDHGRHRSPSKSVGHNDSWDWITGIQDDLQGKDITRLRAYVARQKALAKTEIPLHAADGSTRRRRKSHSMNDKLWAGPSTPVASDTPEATDSGGNTPGSAGDRQSRAGRSGSGGSTATEGSDAGAAQYTCSDAELAHVRSALEMRFPESARLYSDGYIRSVVAQYDSAHPKRRRTLEYCVSLCLCLLLCRVRSCDASSDAQQLNGTCPARMLCTDSEATIRTAVASANACGRHHSPRMPQSAVCWVLVSACLALRRCSWQQTLCVWTVLSQAMLMYVCRRYWYGYDQEFRPILWVRPNKKDWSHLDVDMEVCFCTSCPAPSRDTKTIRCRYFVLSSDVRLQVKMHIRMIEDGIRMMPDNGKVSQFVIVADARGKNPPIAFMRALLIMFTKGYPDRLGAILVSVTVHARRCVGCNPSTDRRRCCILCLCRRAPLASSYGCSSGS